MATEQKPNKKEFLAALNKNGIKSLEDLADAILPEADETGGFSSYLSEENEDAMKYLKSLEKGKAHGLIHHLLTEGWDYPDG